ncbi:hypothetical protein [Dietzia sp. PP-33]|uniref:hypothetical protein n=1 Tax=Dietzia sp. PP-33 TaxID=2957500 RepID=UPI0029AA56BB|nr:hypothetical protein [Dietzia sp. PP-33]MDX2358726.1 hypothetical protein [Dietzia sp. PP-33]
MTRPSSVSIASWIWLFCGLFTTVTIAEVLSATNVLAVLTGLAVDGEDLVAVDVISGFGWLIAATLFAAMVVQVVAAVKLRDGEGWARVLLSIAAVISLVAALYDITMWSAWVLFVANVVAMALAYGDAATDYLEGRPAYLVSA